MTSVCLFLLVWSDSQPSSINSLSMLHNFVAPVTFRAASTRTASRIFLSRRAIVPNSIAIFQKRTYICKIYFSKEFLETLNLKIFNKFSLDQDFSDINLTWSSQLPVFGKKDPGAYGKKYALSLYHS